jgi:hypothetical protein
MANVYKVFMLQTELCARKTITNTTTATARQRLRKANVHQIYKNFSSLLLLSDVYLQLNVFWASSMPSSGAQQLQ